MIYLKGEGYAKGSEFGNPTIIGTGSDQVEQALKNIEQLLTWAVEDNGIDIHTLHISLDAEKLNPKPEFYLSKNKHTEVASP